MAGKSTVIVIIFIFALLLVGWATQLVKPLRQREDRGDHVKFSGVGYLEHSEAQPWSADYITSSAVCPFGKAMGVIFVLYAVLVMVLYPILRAGGADRHKKIDNWFFWVTLGFLVFSFAAALLLNVPLFIRLLPAAALMVIALIVFKAWD